MTTITQPIRKTAIVTGAGRGIGLSIATKLAEDGYNVVIAARSRIEDYRENLALLDKYGQSITYVKADISSSSDRKRILECTLEVYGRVDVLVNNAGVSVKERVDLLEMTEESFDEVIAINTKGTLFHSQLVANQMLRQPKIGKKRGTIINISSFSSVVASTNRGEYCISKAGVSMVTKLFAIRLAAEKIFVHEIRPGVIATEMTSKVHDRYSKMFEEGQFPIARWGEPEDVAEAVRVFCSDAFLYTTGNYLDIDGGYQLTRI